MSVRSYPLTAVPDPATLPRGLFDPRWKEPAVRSRVAAELYKGHRFASRPFGEGALIEPAKVPRFSPAKISVERLALEVVESIAELKTRVRGTAYNELHRRYAFGGNQTTLNFHAQIVSAVIDEHGRWFFHATVGRFGGTPHSEAALTARFFADGEELGGVYWRARLEKAEDIEVALGGEDPRIRRSFSAVDAVELTFFADKTTEQGLITHAQVHDNDSAIDEALAVFGG